MRAGAEPRPTPAPDRGNVALTAIAGLLLFVHWGLVDVTPEPYGSVPIDGPEAEFFAPAGSSPFLIFALTAFLLFSRRGQLKRALGQAPLWAVGTTLLACGAAIGRWANYVDVPELLIPGLMLLLLGSGAVLGGRDGLRGLAPPTLLLGFAFPIPATLVNLIVWPLQLSAAASVEAILRVIGQAPVRFGDAIQTGAHLFQVVESCSGMRMIEVLIMTSVLYSILFYRRGFQVMSLLLLAPILGYFVNLVRILSIMFNPYGFFSSAHTIQGVVMLAVGVLLIVLFDRLLVRLETRWLPAPKSLGQPLGTADKLAWARPMGVALLLTLLGVSNLLIPSWQAKPSVAVSQEPRALRLPFKLAGSTPKGRKLDRNFLGSVGVTKWLHREYEFLGSNVRVQILTNDRLDGRSSLISRKTAVPGLGHSELSHDVISLGGGGYINRYLYQSRDRRTLVYHWYEGTAGRLEEIWRNTFVLDRGPDRRDHWAVAMRLSTVIAPGLGGTASADLRLQEFAEVIRSALQ